MDSSDTENLGAPGPARLCAGGCPLFVMCGARLVGGEMSQQLDTIARIGLASAIVDTYETGATTSTLPATPEINRLLVQLQIETEKAFALYDRLTPRALLRVERKIDFIKAKTSIGKPLSIITFIEFAICILDQPCKKAKGERFSAVRNISEILLKLRSEISCDRYFYLSSATASAASDAWDSIEI